MRDRVTAAALGVFGRIDVVVHSAEISQRSLTEDTDPEVDRTLMELDFFAPTAISMRCCRSSGNRAMVWWWRSVAWPD